MIEVPPVLVVLEVVPMPPMVVGEAGVTVAVVTTVVLMEAGGDGGERLTM